MAYTKQTWQTGDTVTADKLNHMEEGIAEAYNYPEPPEPPEPTPPSVQFIWADDIGQYTFNSIVELINGGTFPILLMHPDGVESDIVALPYIHSGPQGGDAVSVDFGFPGESYAAYGDTADSPLYFD